MARPVSRVAGRPLGRASAERRLRLVEAILDAEHEAACVERTAAWLGEEGRGGPTRGSA